MENKKIEPWMFRVHGEYSALIFGFLVVLILGIIFSSINLWLFLFLLVLGLIYIKLTQAQHLGNSLRVHQKQFPEIFEIFKKHAIALQIPKANLYITQDPYLNAFTIGFNTCTVILTSSLVEQFSKKELSFIIGHELGHFRSGHTKITSFINPLGKTNIFSSFIFGFWNRKAEYTCDRCGLLLTKDIDSGISALLKLTLGGKLFKKLDLDGYVAQLSKSNTNMVKYGELLADHPTITNRINNLLYFWKNSFSVA